MNPYLEQVLWLISWPALILVSYWFVIFALKRYDKEALKKYDEGDEQG
ncbi:MAG: hypothetical protein K9I94_08290 [Bacteroidales bacterium]|nr:hypothetical protein [Bacteroidales bacterium]